MKRLIILLACLTSFTARPALAQQGSPMALLSYSYQSAITVHPWYQSTAIVPGGYFELRGYAFKANAPQPFWRDGGYSVSANGADCTVIQIYGQSLYGKFPNGIGAPQTIRVRGGFLDQTIILQSPPSQVAVPRLTGGGHYAWFDGPPLGLYIQGQTIVQPTNTSIIEIRFYVKDLGGIQNWKLRITGNGKDYFEPFLFEPVDQTDPERVAGKIGVLVPGVYLLQLVAADNPAVVSPPFSFNFQ
jgi:hypothetical protein